MWKDFNIICTAKRCVVSQTKNIAEEPLCKYIATLHTLFATHGLPHLRPMHGIMDVFTKVQVDMCPRYSTTEWRMHAA